MNRDRQYSDVIQVGRSRERHTTEERGRTRKPVGEEYGVDDGYSVVEKPHTSAVRYDRKAVPPRRSALLDDESNPKKTRIMKPPRRFDRWTLITWLCIAIIVMVVGWFLFSKVADWWTGVQDNFKYGTPFRTFQADQYMGMGDTPDHPDHFIALNLHGVIEVVQINPLDRKKDGVYVLANVGEESTPASLTFRDTTGSGRVDVIVTIGDTTPYTIILVNNGSTLTPTQPAH
jgi:hypothetical protein